jgi:hypothetical protein
MGTWWTSPSKILENEASVIIINILQGWKSNSLDGSCSKNLKFSRGKGHPNSRQN